LDKVNPVWKQKGMEQRFFEMAAVTRTNDKISEFHETPLWILGEKYPRSLIEICTDIPAKASPDIQLFSLADAVADSKLSKEDKTEALAGMCVRLKDSLRRRYLLQRLATVDEERCVILLRPLISQLPTDVKGPHWTCEAAYFTQVVMELQQDAVWKDYLKVVRRASVGLRMEMMNSLNYSYIGNKNRQRRLAFLAAFLDDVTVRDPSVDAAKYDGPCAAFTLGKIQVRDFVATKIASILDFPEQPDEFWTADQWSQLRNKVRTALKSEKLPSLAD
jgi:hypothetical protein